MDKFMFEVKQSKTSKLIKSIYYCYYYYCYYYCFQFIYCGQILSHFTIRPVFYKQQDQSQTSGAVSNVAEQNVGIVHTRHLRQNLRLCC